MGKIQIISFISILIYSISYAYGINDCGTIGPIDVRIEDCNEKLNDNFQILSRVEGRYFYQDLNSNLVWHSPQKLIDNRFDYGDINKICPKPYRPPRFKEIKRVLSYADLPFTIDSQYLVIKNHSVFGVAKPGGAMIRERLKNFQYYYDRKRDKRIRNMMRKKDEKKYQLLCVADLTNWHIFGGRD